MKGGNCYAKNEDKRSAAKRFKVTGTGKLKRAKAYKSHILTKKAQKLKEILEKRDMYQKLRKK